MSKLTYQKWLIYHPGHGWLDRRTFDHRDIDEDPIWVPAAAVTALMERAWMFDTRELAEQCIADRRLDPELCCAMAVVIGVGLS